MRVMIIGSGGREHALAWKIAACPRVEKVYAVPGNAGMAATAECIPGKPDDLHGMLRLAGELEVDLTVVGPEAPLTAGLVDVFQEAGLWVFGPSAKAAALEGSKVFAKEIMTAARVPTAAWRSFDDPAEAAAWIEEVGAPIVVKADGLAAGKGVIVASTPHEACQAVEEIMIKSVFGSAGRRIIVEEMLVGEEASMMAFCDGERAVLMDSAQDYKRVSDGDAGPNTGGMGCYSPVARVTPAVREEILESVFKPVLAQMVSLGAPFKGVLYAGIMLTEAGPKVLEFNVRFGDPETQVILPRLESDLTEIMEACIDGDISRAPIVWSPRPAVSVVMASGGYPAGYETGYPISGLAEAGALSDVTVFHAGTRSDGREILTAGGRVLNVTAVGDNFKAAVGRAYEAVARISFHGAHWRRDIGARAVEREA